MSESMQDSETHAPENQTDLELTGKHITQDLHDLLVNYAQIPPEDVVKHVYNTLTQYTFTSHHQAPIISANTQSPFSGTTNSPTDISSFTPLLPRHPLYPDILNRLHFGATLLILGDPLGIDLRRLHYDGLTQLPLRNLFAVDTCNHWDLGHALFRDRGMFRANFIQAEIRAPNWRLGARRGDVDVVVAMGVLDGKRWEERLGFLKEIVRLGRGRGAIVVGWQEVGKGGCDGEGEGERKGVREGCVLDVVESFERLWEEVGSETGTRWRVMAEVVERPAFGWGDRDDSKLLRWTARRQP